MKLGILFITGATWKAWKALSVWVLIKNTRKRESKEKRSKERGTTKRGTTALGSRNDDDRHGILWWWACARTFAHVSFITQSPPLVTPGGDLCGSSS